MMKGVTVPTKDRLRNAAVEIIINAGLQACTDRAVARKARSTVKQIDRNFGSYDGLIVDLYDRAWQLITASLSPLLPQMSQAKKDPEAAFGLLADAILIAMEKDKQLIQAMAIVGATSLGTPLARKLNESLNYQVFAGSFKMMAANTVEPQTLDILFGMVLGAIKQMVIMATPLVRKEYRWDELESGFPKMIRRAVRGMVAGVTAK